MQVIQNLWYPILESRELKQTGPLGIRRLGVDMVIWRGQDGSLQAQSDRCPHLGAAMSKGKVIGDRIVCPFHGFEFDATGTCRHIPAEGRKGRIPGGMALKTYPVREAHGLIWLWWGDQRQTYPQLPFFDLLESGFAYDAFAVEWPVHYTRAIENQLDVAHLPFIHKSTIGAGGNSFVDGPYVEADAEGIRMWIFNQRDHGQAHRDQRELAKLAANQEPSIRFLFPGIWLLTVAPGMRQFLAFVPVDEGVTRYYLRTYHRVTLPVLKPLYGMVLNFFNRLVLNQDKSAVLSQLPRNSSQAGHERLIGADRGIAQFRRWHARLLKAEISPEITPEITPEIQDNIRGESFLPMMQELK